MNEYEWDGQSPETGTCRDREESPGFAGQDAG